MKKEMLINVLQPEECRIAIVEDGALEELYVERTSQESYVNNIYKGRIVNIEPSIQAAFVDFGIGRNGFLHVSDVDPVYYKHLDRVAAAAATGETEATGVIAAGVAEATGMIVATAMTGDDDRGRRPFTPVVIPSVDAVPPEFEEEQAIAPQEITGWLEPPAPAAGGPDDEFDDDPFGAGLLDDRSADSEEHCPRRCIRWAMLSTQFLARRRPPTKRRATARARGAAVRAVSRKRKKGAEALPAAAAANARPTRAKKARPANRLRRAKRSPKQAPTKNRALWIRPNDGRAAMNRRSNRRRHRFRPVRANDRFRSGPAAKPPSRNEKQWKKSTRNRKNRSSAAEIVDEHPTADAEAEDIDEADDDEEDESDVDEDSPSGRGGPQRGRGGDRGDRGGDRGGRRPVRSGRHLQPRRRPTQAAHPGNFQTRPGSHRPGHQGRDRHQGPDPEHLHQHRRPLSRADAEPQPRRRLAQDHRRRRPHPLERSLTQLNPPKGIGFIIRTAAIDRNKAELRNDLSYLVRLWEVFSSRVLKRPAPVEIYRESDMITRTIRDIFTSDIDSIYVDEVNAFTQASEFLKIVMPRYADRIKHYADTEPIFTRFKIDPEIARINEKKIPLAMGGSIVIEQTEALVAIDVNSGNFRAENNAEETAYQMNLQAAKEIGRQLRLRDLGGVIVNDFIDMKEERHRRNVEQALRNALRRDRARTKILKTSPSASSK